MSELSYEASDEASENELLERSLSVWRGWSSLREDFTPIPLDIHTASSIGQYECVRNLISRGEVEIDRKNIGGWTPLMYACYIGHDHIVSLLIDAGCNVNLKNQRGHTPLMLAASCGNETVGRTLLRKGAELEASDRNGWTALFHATYSGHQNFVGFLLDQRANMDAAEPSTGMTPFMEAAVEGHEIIVQLFLQHGVNVNAKAYNGDTARTLALTYSYMKIVSLIDNHVMPHSTLRSEPGLGDYLSSSDEVDKRQRPQHQRGSRAKSKGPSIRDGPEAIARMIDRTRATDHPRYPHLMVPRGYMSFHHGDGEGEEGDTLLSYRDVTSPINQEDYRLDSSGGKDSCDYNDDSNAFSKTGAITIKSSSSSSGGLIAALGMSRQNSADSDEFRLHDSGVHNSSQSEEDNNANEREEEEEEVGADSVRWQHGQDEAEGFQEDTEENRSTGSSKAGAPSLPVDRKSNQRRASQEKSGSGDQDGSKRLPQQPQKDDNEHIPAEDRKSSAPHMDLSGSGGGEGNAAAPVSKSLIDSDVRVSGDLSSDGGNHARFLTQFSALTIPEMLSEQAVGENPLAPSAALNALQHFPDSFPIDRNRLFECGNAEGSSLERNRGFEPTAGSTEGTESLMDFPGPGLAVGCFQFAGPTQPSPSQQPPSSTSRPERRSSCQSRLTRLSVGDRDGNSKDTGRHRRRSANSPPTFHRDYGGRGHDLGSGTGRVSCLSEIPTNPGPQAGYPVTCGTSKKNGSGGGGGGVRFLGNNGGQVPVAAVAPTCLPVAAGSGGDGCGDGSYHTHAFNAPAHKTNPQHHQPQQGSLPRKHSAPEISSTSFQPPPGFAQDTNPAPSGIPGYQSDGLAGQRGAQPETPAAAGWQQAGDGGSDAGLPWAEIPGGGHVAGGGGSGDGAGQCDLTALLEQLGLSKYSQLFAEQDVDLQVFLSLTDNDLKEIGIKLFGPRKKMTNAIARWHSQAPAARSSLEQAYADRLEGEMQEMAIQLNQAYDSVEKLRAQVLQERQLRSVTESCLMEERGAWQRVHHSLMDTHQHCRGISEAVNSLSSLQAELKQRLAQPQNNSHLALNTAASPSELTSLTSDQLSRLCDQHLFDLRQHSSALTLNMECIVSNPPATGTIPQARELDQDFP